MSTIDELNTALAGRYHIERELGAGGMATVYLGRDVKHEREVAVKVLREDLSASIGAGRFLREIKIAAQLQHPNILPLLDSGEAGGRLYFVMPYVRGQSLRERLSREGELPVHEAVRLLIEIVDALADAHSHGVVHRDIKPDNVMLSGRHALVMDFGVAKAISEATGRNTVTTLGVAVGTPTYMSPEQAVADPLVDHRSDIYAVGVVAYEMLNGRPPFVGATPQQVLAAHVTEAPDSVSKRRPAIPAALDAIVMRCLAKRPADRFQTATELLAALEPLATPSTGITPAEVQPLRTGERNASHRPRSLIPAVVAGVVAILIVVAIALTRSREPAATALERVQLTTNGHSTDPVLSPDGKEVVYTDLECPADTLPCMSRLVMQDVASGARQPVSEDLDQVRATAWSATGAWILANIETRNSAEMPQLYVMSHLGGTRVPVGMVATFTPQGDTVVSLASGLLRGARTITLRSFVAPWTQAIDSVMVAVPEHAIFARDMSLSPDGQWFAMRWDEAGQNYSVLTLLDRRGKQVASRVLPPSGGGPPAKWTRDGLLRPLVANGQSGLEHVAVSARTGAMSIRDTVMLFAGSAPPTISMAAASSVAAYAEDRPGQTSVFALAAPSASEVPRIVHSLITDAAIQGVDITPDGATIVYWTAVAAGSARASQFFALPFAGGAARQITAPLAGLLYATLSGDGKQLVVASSLARGRSRLAAYDISNGREVASAERADTLFGIAGIAGGVALQLENTVIFVDDSLRETRRVAIPDSLGRAGGVMMHTVNSGTALTPQPFDFSSTFQNDWNFHVPLMIADPSGKLRAVGSLASWGYFAVWWLGDGSLRFVGNLGTDPRWALFRITSDGGPEQRVGYLPFRFAEMDAGAMDLSADATRGVLMMPHSTSDVWLIKNFGQVVH